MKRNNKSQSLAVSEDYTADMELWPVSCGSQKLLRFYTSTVKSQYQREVKQGQQINIVNKLFSISVEIILRLQILP